MNIISTRSRYGLRLLVALADRQGQGPVDIGSVAAQEDIPEKYLAKLVVPLKAAGLVRASRGVHGGYELARPPESIDLLTVVEVMEGRKSLLDCTADPGSCGRSGTCPTHSVWKGLEEALRSYLGARRLSELTGRKEPDYVI